MSGADGQSHESDYTPTLEMSRRVEQAERRAEDAEAAIEAARDLLDGWEQDGPDDPAVRLLIQRVRGMLALGDRFRAARDECPLGKAVCDPLANGCDGECETEWQSYTCTAGNHARCSGSAWQPDITCECKCHAALPSSTCGDSEMDESAASNGEYRVEHYCAGPDGDDPDGRPYYLLDLDGRTFGGNYWAYPEHVSVVRTAETNATRTPPSTADVTRAVSNALHSMSDAVYVDGTSASGPDRGVVMAYGDTEDGLRVSFRVCVDRIEEVDL